MGPLEGPLPGAPDTPPGGAKVPSATQVAPARGVGTPLALALGHWHGRQITRTLRLARAHDPHLGRHSAAPHPERHGSKVLTKASYMYIYSIASTHGRVAQAGQVKPPINGIIIDIKL